MSYLFNTDKSKCEIKVLEDNYALPMQGVFTRTLLRDIDISKVIVLAFEYTNDYPSSSTATWKSAGKVRSYDSETYPQLEKNGTKLTVQFYNDSNSDVTYYYRLYYMIID